MLTSTHFQITQVTIQRLVKYLLEYFQFIINFKILRYGIMRIFSLEKEYDYIHYNKADDCKH